MKTSRIMLLLISVIFQAAWSQNFVEITTNGWGLGEAGSKAVFVDLDNNGRLDMLLAGSYAPIAHYEQETPDALTFTLVNSDFLGITTNYYCALCVTEFNGNNRLDLILDDGNRTQAYYEQTSENSREFTLIRDNLTGIYIGSSLSPCVADIDGDGLYDLLFGEYDGNLNHFEQSGPNSTDWTLLTENFNDIDVGIYAEPTLADIDGDGLLDLIIGDSGGTLMHYEQEAVQSLNFQFRIQEFNDINVGFYSTPVFTDINNDDLLDLFVGEWDGNLNYYVQEAPGTTTFLLVSETFYQPPEIDVGSAAAPCVTDLGADGLLDLLIGERTGQVLHYQQQETGSLQFTRITDTFNNIETTNESRPAVTDLDSNGRLDLIVGSGNGILKHFEQNTDNPEQFDLISELFSAIDVGRWAAPCFMDLDNNGLLDLLVGNREGNLQHFEQNADNSVEFTQITEYFNDIDVGYGASPSAGDLDNNGKIDLLIGNLNGNITHYEQSASGSRTFYLQTEKFLTIPSKNFVKPAIGDINGDGRMDVLVGENKGGIYLFQQIEGTGIPSERPITGTFRMLQNYPNPFNPDTRIHFVLTQTARVKISVYDIRGRLVRQLANEEFREGQHTVIWNGRDDAGTLQAGGVYVCRIQSPQQQRAIKMIFLP